jgi:hypothetical protein
MNLFELQERLKDFSQDQLVREMQAPTGTAPQFLVLSELQRRQRMMAESQAQMPQDQTTVAEDAVAAAGVPQGGLADMARAMAPRTDMDMNTGVAPVERMRDGGVVRMQPGGLAGISRDLDVYSPTMGGARAIPDIMMEEEDARRRRAEIAAAAEPLLRFDREGRPNVEGFAADLAALGIIPDEELLTEEGPDPRFYPTEGRLASEEELEPVSDSTYTEALRSDIARQRRRLTPDDYRMPETDPLDPRSPSYVPPSAASLGFDPEDTAPVDSSGLGLPDYMFSQRGTVPEPQPGQGIMPSDIGREIGERFGFGPAMDVARETRSLEETLATEREAARVAEAARMMEINEIPATTRRVTDEGEIIAPPVVTPPDAEEDVESIVRGGGGAGASAVDDAFNQDKWLALAQVGLSLMSSKQPTLGGAIGEAGLSGITALRQARDERDARAAAAQARADRLAARERAPGYEDDVVGDLLEQRDLLEREASSYFDSELNAVRPGYEERYNRILQRMDVIDSVVGTVTMERFPGLMAALTGE